jgi:hypothetical protein
MGLIADAPMAADRPNGSRKPIIPAFFRGSPLCPADENVHAAHHNVVGDNKRRQRVERPNKLNYPNPRLKEPAIPAHIHITGVLYHPLGGPSRPLFQQ